MGIKVESISGHDINSEAFRNAAENANRAYYQDNSTFPNYIRNDPAVKKLLYLMKLDEEYKRKPR